MEHRIYITIPGLPFEDEAAWEPLMEVLERDFGELGPVVGWHGQDAEIVVATDAADKAEAAEIAFAAAAASLHTAKLGDRFYPVHLEVELVEVDEAVPA